MPASVLRSLIVDGVIAGVGGVLVFLPQILILFGFIAVLEECGYMARAAYLTDKLMSRIGLSGKSFIPLLSSFACAVPGVMATRAIENRRDRLVTILIAPLMSCSARLQVYSLLIAAFIPDRRYLGGWVRLQGITLLAMYLLGVVVAVVVALVLRRTLLRGQTPSFVMELPSYRLPSLRSVAARVGESGWSFVQQAGTLIVAVAVVVWAAAYFPARSAGGTGSSRPVRGTAAAARRPHRRRAGGMPPDQPPGPRAGGRLASGKGRAGAADQQRGRRGVHGAELLGPGRQAGSRRWSGRWAGIGGSAAR